MNTPACMAHPGILPVNEYEAVASLSTTGTVAFAAAPTNIANIRLGDVTISANGATTVTLTIGGLVEVVYFGGADTVVLPRGLCGTGGPGTMASTGSGVAVNAVIPWNYDYPAPGLP